MYPTINARALVAVLLTTGAAQASTAPLRTDLSMQTEAVVAASTRERSLSQSRLTLLPQSTFRSGRTWSGEVRLRLELTGSNTGLGTLETYDTFSEPWRLGEDARLEVDSAQLTWRQRNTLVTLGKQTVAWGVLDGVQVTDRFDAVRRREAIFTEQRPERLSRWGARLRFRWGETRIDTALALDGSVNQLANSGEVYDVRAPRFRGGLPASVVPASINVAVPDTATAGLRLERTFGSSDASVMVIHGPDTEPVFRSVNATGVELAYPTRTLFGATWQRAAGARVWRLEAAHVPQQPINYQAGPALATGRESRWLVGSGLDWSLPGGIFLNAQLAVDHISGDERPLTRPDTDVVATLRAQRSFSNDRWMMAAEILGTLSDGDGTFRPSLTWRPQDNLGIDVGADLTWGQEQDLIGQFEGASRVYIRLRKSF